MPLGHLFFILLLKGLPPLDIFFVNQSQGFHPTVTLLFGIHTQEEPRFTSRGLPPVDAQATVLWDFFVVLCHELLERFRIFFSVETFLLFYELIAF